MVGGGRRVHFVSLVQIRTWTCLGSFAPTWHQRVSLGFTWTALDSLGPIWNQLDSLGLSGPHLGSLAPTWPNLNSFGPTWSNWNSLGSRWTIHWDPRREKGKLPAAKRKMERPSHGICFGSHWATKPGAITRDTKQFPRWIHCPNLRYIYIYIYIYTLEGSR